jgi:hypothetical protein
VVGAGGVAASGDGTEDSVFEDGGGAGGGDDTGWLDCAITAGLDGAGVGEGGAAGWVFGSVEAD